MASEKQNLEQTTSDLGGFAGFFERALRRYKVAVHIITIMPLYFVCCIILGIGLIPAVLIVQATVSASSHLPQFVQVFALAVSLPLGYLAYGMTMIFVVPFFNFCGQLYLKPWRGSYYSAPAVGWYIHNALTYLLRFTFLEFICPTPMLNLFYVMMGMKIGDGTVINSTYFSDPSLITLGEKVTIGGSVTIVGHYGQAGYLVLAPVVIGDRATIGLKASIMGGAKIGANVKILPHSIVLPKTEIPEGETWGGVPAKKISMDDLKQSKGQPA
jgi:hypothetical protein